MSAKTRIQWTARYRRRKNPAKTFISIPRTNQPKPSAPLQGASTDLMEALIDRATTPETSDAQSSRSLKATVTVEANREPEPSHRLRGVEEIEKVQEDTKTKQTNTEINKAMKTTLPNNTLTPPLSTSSNNTACEAVEDGMQPAPDSGISDTASSERTTQLNKSGVQIDEIVAAMEKCCVQNLGSVSDPCEVDKLLEGFLVVNKSNLHLDKVGYCFGAGIVTRKFKFLKSSVNWFLKAAECARVSGDRIRQANSLGLLASVKCDQGRLKEADSILQEAVNISNKTGDPGCIAHQDAHWAALLFHKANALPRRSNKRKLLIKDLIKVQERVIKWAKEAKQYNMLPKLIGNLAGAYHEYGDMKGSIRCMKELEEVSCLNANSRPL